MRANPEEVEDFTPVLPKRMGGGPVLVSCSFGMPVPFEQDWRCPRGMAEDHSRRGQEGFRGVEMRNLGYGILTGQFSDRLLRGHGGKR
jgi:hypothetical protein